jgi:hypothetical protein
MGQALAGLGSCNEPRGEVSMWTALMYGMAAMAMNATAA